MCNEYHTRAPVLWEDRGSHRRHVHAADTARYAGQGSRDRSDRTWRVVHIPQVGGQALPGTAVLGRRQRATTPAGCRKPLQCIHDAKVSCQVQLKFGSQPLQYMQLTSVRGIALVPRERKGTRTHGCKVKQQLRSPLRQRAAEVSAGLACFCSCCPSSRSHRQNRWRLRPRRPAHVDLLCGPPGHTN